MSTHPLESVFRPRSIALFGVPRNPESRSNQFFLQGLLDQGYHLRRPLYLVNPNADRIEGGPFRDSRGFMGEFIRMRKELRTRLDKEVPTAPRFQPRQRRRAW